MNNVKFASIMNIVKIVIAVLGVGLSISLFFGPNTDATTEAITEFREGASLSGAIWYFIVIFLSCIGLILAFFLFQLISNPKRTVMSIIGIVAALVFYLIYLGIGTSDTSETLQFSESLGEISNSTVTTTTAGIYTVLTGLALALLAIILSPVMGKLRK